MNHERFSATFYDICVLDDGKSEKKARTFDVMAMFKEAHQTAINRRPVQVGKLLCIHIFSFAKLKKEKWFIPKFDAIIYRDK